MIIVTGGAGLIGSAIIWRLNQLGREDILVVDHLGCSEKWKNLSPLRFRDYLEKDDFLARITAKDGIDSICSDNEQIDTIFHLGACSATTELDASYLISNNFEYSKQLALFALKRDIRFIYASSAATYGEGENGFCDDDSKIHQLRPLNMYGYSKQLFDIWARNNGILDGIVGLKYFNVFGPNEYHKGDMRSLVVKAYEQIISTGRLKLFRSHRDDYADGEQKRDFIYVKDAADMTISFMNNRNANGIFNIGGAEASTWNRLANAIFSAIGQTPQIDYIDMPESIREKYQYYTCADTAKIRATGYDKPVTPLEDSVGDYVKNYLTSSARLS